MVRLGWEANIGSAATPGGSTARPGAGLQGVLAPRRRAAQGGRPGPRLEWTNAKKTANTALHVLGLYPGDDVVDLWGVHYYDSGPQKSTQELWDEVLHATFNGGPWGLGTWLAAARQHGKKLAVSEWGVWRQAGQAAAAADDPVYVDNMYRFFRDERRGLAYESYFDKLSAHQLCPSTLFPNAAAKYQADWGLGATAARSAPR